MVMHITTLCDRYVIKYIFYSLTSCPIRTGYCVAKPYPVLMQYATYSEVSRYYAFTNPKIQQLYNEAMGATTMQYTNKTAAFPSTF